MKRFIAILASIAAVLMLVAPPAMADVANPPDQRPRDVLTATFYQPGPLTTAGTVTTYTGITMVGGSYRTDASNVGYWALADVFVSAAITTITGTGYLTVTPQFSNDWVNWRNAAIVTINPPIYSSPNISWTSQAITITSGVVVTSAVPVTVSVGSATVTTGPPVLFLASSIVSTPIVWPLSTTGTVGYPISIQGDYMRFKIDVTNGVSTTVTPLVRVTFKNYGALQ